MGSKAKVELQRWASNALEKMIVSRPDGSGSLSAAAYPYSWTPLGVNRVLSRQQEM